MTTIRLTAAQAMVKWLSVQMTEEGERFIEGVWAIFGHGNVIISCADRCVCKLLA